MVNGLIDKLKMIYDNFGETEQRKKLVEEALEYAESGEDEEIADVLILSLQLYMNNFEVRKIVEQKINRTLERISNNYYGEIK